MHRREEAQGEGRGDLMIEDYPHICTDPLGDPHTIMEKYYICGVAEDRSSFHQFNTYHLGWYRTASYQKDEPELLHGRRAY